jgi:hypothetical protein
MSVDEAIAIYCAAWNEFDPVKRDQMLEPVWADDATYTDPTAHTVGRAALVAHIGTVCARFPGSTIVMTSPIDVHHNALRFYWKRILADGSSRPEGIDFGEIAENGKIQRIVGFFGPLERRSP